MLRSDPAFRVLAPAGAPGRRDAPERWCAGPSVEPAQRRNLFGRRCRVLRRALVGGTVAAARRVRWLPLWGSFGALVLAGVAAVDLGRFVRIGAVELAIAAAALAVSLATAAGLVRASSTHP